MAKTKAKPENIFRSVAAFNGLLQLFGLGFHFNVETGEMKVNLCNRIGFLLNLSWSLLGIVVALSEKPMKSTSEVVATVWHYQYLLQVILVLPLLIFNYIKRKHAANFLAKVHEFDVAIAKINWTSSKLFPTGARRYLEIGLIVSSILIIFLFHIAVFEFEQFSLAIFNIFVYLYVTEFFLLVSFQFVFGALTVYRRFQVLNNNVRILLDSTRHRLSWSEQNQCMVVRSAINCHDILNDAIDEINEVFSLEMVPSFLMALMTEVFFAYSIIESHTLYFDFSYYSVLSKTVMILYIVTPTLAAIYVGSIAREEGLKMTKMFARLANSCEIGHLQTRIASTVTTYLIIICQLENPQNMHLNRA